MSATETGARGEALARRYLEAQGWSLLYQNYRSGKYEIDLVMRDGGYVVFVEVKARRTTRFGAPAEFVTPAKRKRLIVAAGAYLAEYGLADSPARFDVVEVYLATGAVRHLPNAFLA